MHKTILGNFKQLGKKEAKAVKRQAIDTSAVVCHAFLASYYSHCGDENSAKKILADCPRRMPCPLAHDIAGSNATIYLDVRIVPKDYFPVFYTPPIPDDMRQGFAQTIIANVNRIKAMPIIYGSAWLPNGFSFAYSADGGRIDILREGKEIEGFPNSLGVVHWYKIGEEIFFPTGLAPGSLGDPSAKSASNEQPLSPDSNTK